jgi:hypothetical protein
MRTKSAESTTYRPDNTMLGSKPSLLFSMKRRA